MVAGGYCFKKISRAAALTLDGMKNHNTTDSTQIHKKHTAIKYKKVVKQIVPVLISTLAFP